jgi:hypothetical protein
MRRSISTTSAHSLPQQCSNRARRIPLASWSPTRRHAYPQRRRMPREGSTAMTNHAPDRRNTEGRPKNIKIQFPYLRIPLRQGRTRERIRCTLGRTSTGTHHRPETSTPLCLLAEEFLPETPDPMGLVESIFATTLNLREVGTKSARRNPAGAGTRNAHLSQCNPGMMEVVAVMARAATAAGVSTAKRDVVSLMAEARNLAGPRMDLHHHPSVQEVEAKAGGQAPTQNPLATGGTHVTRGNVSMNIRLDTLDRSASERGSRRSK